MSFDKRATDKGGGTPPRAVGIPRQTRGFQNTTKMGIVFLRTP